MKGKLIIIDGIDGSGTTTQSHLLVKKLRKYQIPTQLTKEPNNKYIIKLIKENRENIADLFLFLADRSLHYLKIKQWLKEGKWIITDRSFPSTLVYQWYAGDLNQLIAENLILFLNHLSQLHIQPDLIFILDVNPQTAFNRLKNKNKKSQINKYEKIKLMKKLQLGYRYFAKKYQWKIINANQSIEEVNKNILEEVLKLINIKKS
jgi:dTMP kinase